MPSSRITQRTIFRRAARLRQTRLAEDRRIKQLRNTPAWGEELEDEPEEIDGAEKIDSYDSYDYYNGSGGCSVCFEDDCHWLREHNTDDLDAAVEKMDRKLRGIESEFGALEACRVTEWLEHAGR